MSPHVLSYLKLPRLGLILLTAALVLMAVGVAALLNRGAEKQYYTPGSKVSREDCFYDRIRQYNKVTRQVLNAIASECELTVQSIEGHERMRKEWEARQAARVEEAPAPAPAPAAPPADRDQIRRVWR
ncbi:hypothetical protein [Ferrovibrio sp.]|uniref:hypothetical protein n=1 Tax=Ferrovibrio sp. TaxID=1917215 RepID=UPI003513FF80